VNKEEEGRWGENVRVEIKDDVELVMDE